MIVGVLKETCPGETRVALVPAAGVPLGKLKLELLVESGAGEAAGFPDAKYVEKGFKTADRATVFEKADVVLQVRTPGANPQTGPADAAALRKGQLLIGHADPLSASDAQRQVAASGATLLAVELVPRITRAQAMDALSSQTNIAGYKAVLLAAEKLPRIFPMLMTAAGTIKPAKVLVLGVGVAGLQAIATARRLGAIVSAYDIRPVVKEQVQSLGAKFVELPLDTADAQDKGGYAKAQSADQLRKQQELLARTVAENDVVITTALIPGQKAPIMVTADMVKGMQPGSVIVDLAAERGGNCELTEPGATVVKHAVTIVGITNVATTVALNASEMYSGNLVKMLELIVAKDGTLKLDTTDEIVAGCLVAKDGEVVHARVRTVLGLPPLAPPAPPPPPATPAAAPSAPVTAAPAAEASAAPVAPPAPTAEVTAAPAAPAASEPPQAPPPAPPTGN